MMHGDSTPPGSGKQAGRSLAWGRWVAAVVITLLLGGLSLARSRWLPLKVMEKGARAQHTIRATHDAVYDLHQTHVEEAEEAKQSYIPIYNQDYQLIYAHRSRTLSAARARPLASWGWPEVPRPKPAPPPRPDAGARSSSDASPPAATGKAPEAGSATPPVSTPRSDASLASAEAGLGPDATTATPAPPPASGPTPDQALPTREKVLRARRQELEALVRGYFLILQPFFKAGVVADNEFPSGRSTVRVEHKQRFQRRQVSKLYRFSDLRPALMTSAAKFFFKTDAVVRRKVIEFVLSTLTPNMTYARVNSKFISDISEVTGVKVMLIRRGDILLRKDEVVDTHAYYAIRASVMASASSEGWENWAARLGILLAVMLLFAITTREVCGAQFRGIRSYLVVHGGMLCLAAGGAALLVYLPVPAAAVPQAALALAVAVVLGRAPGLLTGIAFPFVLMLVQVFDLSTLLVSVSGGVTAALVVRQRRRGTAIPAGVLVGIVQAVVFEACRAMEGRPRTADELWYAGEVFVGGVATGLVALPMLPFVERFLGRTSRGKLKVITDFDHPLVRELREKAAGTFSHTVNLINMVELAVDAVGGDRLLARAGTLFHDIGKMNNPGNFIENQGVGPNVHDSLSPRESAMAIRAHVEEGLVIARKHRLPLDVMAFIPEHHGTTGMDYFIHKAKEAGESVDPEAFHYPGPKPRSVETAILMIADSIEAASRTLDDPSEESLAALVDRIVFNKYSQFQFEECGITQGQLTAVKEAFVSYLKGMLHRRVAYPEEGDGKGEPQPPVSQTPETGEVKS